MTALTRRTFGLGLSSLALAACEERANNASALAVLLDVSGSYYRELPKNLRAIRAMMGFIHAGDSFAVAEIGACSFTDESMILRFTAPDRPSERHSLVSAHAARLNDYGTKAKATNYTDIRGALTQAAQYLASRKAVDRTIVIFSDLEEDLPPNCRRETALPAELRGMNVIACNVIKLPEDNRDPARYGRRVEGWRRLVQSAGARWQIMPDPADIVGLLRDRQA
ncbi:MAG: hypothetical protein NTV97_36075 [Alphaproteobacteria bacterium]|nr:hypothetical protein [Alphaproteobacteria bacterium]